MIVNNCFFTGNTAGVGGGVYDEGGGIFNDGTLTVTDSVFINNSALNGGGGIYNSYPFDNHEPAGSGTVTVTNSIFIGNSATGDGGGIFNESGNTVTANNSIFVENSAIEGGGIYNLGTLIKTNNLFFDNTGGDIYS